ncbi:MAG: DNA primase [Patescibacteria group bacterium]
MAENQVEEVKQKSDIVSVIGERIELKKAGRNFKANCPFHGEKTPSFVVSPELQIYKCFGCQQAGDVFTFLEEYEGMGFGEALKYLADKVGIKLKQVANGQASEKEKYFEINSLAARFYNYILLNLPVGKEALSYLMEERGLKMDTIKTFGIGFAPDKDDALFSFLSGKKKINPKELEISGLAVGARGKHFDRFKGRIIFPIADARGNTIALAGRILPKYEREGIGKYINSPETPIYHKGSTLYGLDITKKEIKKEGVAVVVEGEVDLISSYQNGVKNVVAIKGSALTPDQIRLLSRITNNIILCLDSDFAGEEASRRGIANAYDLGLLVHVASFRKYKDPDEFARADKEGFKKALEKAVPAWDFLINTAVQRDDTTTGEGKQKISREVVPILALITDKIVQSHYISTLAKRISVDESAVATELERFISKQAPPKVEVFEKEENVVSSRRELLEEKLIVLLYKDPETVIKSLGEIPVKSPFVKRILEEHIAHAKKHKKFNVADFVKGLPEELSKKYSEIVLKEEEEGDTIHALEQVKYELQKLELKEEIQGLSKEISTNEAEGDKKGLEKAQKKLRDVSLRLSKLSS